MGSKIIKDILGIIIFKEYMYFCICGIFIVVEINWYMGIIYFNYKDILMY